MAIDASIYNRLQMPNWGQSLTNGLLAGARLSEQPMRNELLNSQVERSELSNDALRQQISEDEQNFMLQDMATDAIQIKKLAQTDPMQAQVALAQRIKKIQDRGGDPSDTMAARELLTQGRMDEFMAELDAPILAAQQRGLLNQGMTEYQRQNLELQRMRLEAQNGDPASVKEYKYFQGLNEKQKREYLAAKRAGTYYKQGDVTMQADPLTGTGTAVVERGAGPATQADVQSTITGQQSVKEAAKEAAKTAIQKSEEAFDRIEPIRQSIANYDEAIRLIDEGAGTGVIQSKLPSVKQASQELDNLQGRLGLDVVGNTTFGALSEAELRFALDTALPKNLEGPALKQWVQRKKQTQQKLLSYVQQAATYLGTPGNTVAGWVSEQRSQALNRVPPQALEYLKQNPQLSDQFMDKYGVLPDGF